MTLPPLVEPEPATAQEIQREPAKVVAKAEVVSQDEEISFEPTASPIQPTTQEKNSQTSCDILCCGDDNRKGIRVQPGNNLAIKLCGNTNVVLPNEPPAGAHYKFILMNLCGDAQFLVPKGTKVILRRIALCGNRTIDTDEETEIDHGSNPIKVTVTIVQLCGEVTIATHG
ncbi:hypothetical protein HJC23_008118 [Cyclotella cryptica]|uniref:Uncharacterized protein n=1 Tax=Cyclotella cryptica TaxID=29204 RepID=A0ABD3PD14_9STRA